ncbi:6732_t:CDS:2 [Entrophospora sp. SA101]|nr:6732_t:CDS:2 [Entrophospora sp. SA101]CAJ0877746.1 5904_t:CDS:2 [Entrophospora sp. SA101]
MSNSPNPAHIQNNVTYIDTKMTSDPDLHYNEIDYLVNSLSSPLSSLSINDSEESNTKKLYHQQQLNLIKRNCPNCSDEDWDSFINLLYSNSISDDDLFEIIKSFINPNFNYPHVLINIESKYQNFFNNLKFCLYQESKVRLLQNQRYGLDQQPKHQYQPTSLLSSKYLEGDLHIINTINNNYYYNNFILNNDVVKDDEIIFSKNENSELYDHFIRILFTTRESMPDDLWEESVFECLGNWPNLIEQFKQIIIRETINF